MPTIVGPGFALESVTQLSATSLCVKFTQNPKAVSAAATNDALNPENYSLTGPGLNHVLSVSTVAGDPQSVALTLKAPLLIGGWTLSVANVVEDNLNALTPPTALDFIVATQPTQTPLHGGASNDEAAAVIRKFLNPALVGKGWDSMIAALAAGDAANWENAKKAFNQLFLSTASGIYLDRRAGDYGQKRPEGVDMPDEIFRRLAIIGKTRKLTQEAVLEVLEVYYGRDALRGFATTGTFETFTLNDGDTLSILFDEKDLVTTTFKSSEFIRISQATALEVAAAITRACKAAGNQGFAVAQTDQTTGQVGVRVYSGSLGLSSSVRIVGGRAQTQLLFPTSIFPFSSSSPTAVWSVSLSPTTPGNVRFTMTSGSVFDLTDVQAGDLVYIYGAEFAACSCIGTFTITDVSVTYAGSVKTQWFEFANEDGTAGSVTQTSFTDLMFFRPVRHTIYEHPRHVVVAQADDALDIVIPATTQAVGRSPGIAGYLNDNDTVEVTSLVRTPTGDITVMASAPHGLAAGDQIVIDDAFPTGAAAPVTTGAPSGDFSGGVATGTTDASLATTASEAHTFEGVNHKVARTPEGLLLIIGGQTQTNDVTITSLANPVVFEIVNEVVDGNTGGREQNYKWTKLASSFHTARRAFGLSASSWSGKVLATGGTNGDDVTGTPNNHWDLYTYTNAPPRNTQATGTMPISVAAHAQASLGIYGELISGGWTTPGVPIATAYIFDTVAQTWTAKASMKRARMYHQIVPLPGNPPLGLAIGGKTDTKVLAACETYDAVEDAWTPTCSMTYARYNFGAVALGDGRVLVVGGKGYHATQSTTQVTLATCELYDPTSKLWSVIPPMALARENPAIAYIPSQNVVMVAGSGSTTIEILDVATMRWRRSLSSLSVAFIGSVGALAGVDTFTVIGGVLAG